MISSEGNRTDYGVGSDEQKEQEILDLYIHDMNEHMRDSTGLFFW